MAAKPPPRKTLAAFREQVKYMISQQRDPRPLLELWDGASGIRREYLEGTLEREIAEAGRVSGT